MSKLHHHAESTEPEHADFAHPAPIWMLLGVFFALVGLTILTVVVSDFAEALRLGRFEIWVSMGIATVKAALVIFIFMHLLFDKPFNQMIFFAAFLFVAMFIGTTLMDTAQYQSDVDAYNDPLPERKAGTVD